MIDRRRAIRLALAMLPAAALLRASTARAEQSFQRFVPLLIDLDGWQGKKPDGVSLEAGSAGLITAGREYRRGAARLHAQVLIGPAAQAALAATKIGTKIETSEGHMNTSLIDGLSVTRSFTEKTQSGAILVALGANALFDVSFNGITEDEALALAKKFNWKAMQAEQAK